MSSASPLVRTFTFTAPAVGTAGNDDTAPALIVPFDGEVTAVEYVTKSTLTGANTNYRTCALVNKGSAGSGTTVVASKAFTSGVDATGLAVTAITLSAVDGATDVSEGDVLQWTSTHTASGLADPGGHVRITISRA